MKAQSDTQFFIDLQSGLYRNLFDILGFQTDTPKLHEKFKKDKEALIEYILEGNYNNEDQETIDRMIENIKSEKEKVDRYPKIVYSMSLVYALAHFEAYLRDTLKKLLEIFPKTLSTSKKQMSYEDILKHSSGEKIIDSIIERELIEVSFKNITDQIEYLASKFNIRFEYEKGEATWGTDKLDIEKLREIFSIRNLILHNNGIVNIKFSKDNPGSRYNISDKIELSEHDVSDAIILLLAITYKISYRATQKGKVKD